MLIAKTHSLPEIWRLYAWTRRIQEGIHELEWNGAQGDSNSFVAELETLPWQIECFPNRLS